MSLVPGIAGGAAALMTFSYIITRRQKAMAHRAGAAKSEPVDQPEEVQT
jgi:hypothetical protein